MSFSGKLLELLGKTPPAPPAPTPSAVAAFNARARALDITPAKSLIEPRKLEATYMTTGLQPWEK